MNISLSDKNRTLNIHPIPITIVSESEAFIQCLYNMTNNYQNELIVT